MTRWFGSFGASRSADLGRLAAGALGRPALRIAAVFALAAAFLGLLTLQEVELRRERAGYNYLLTTNNWALSQLEYELERFLGALDRYMLGVPEVDAAFLALRFDILWSRIPVLLEGVETVEVRKIAGAPERLRIVADTLAEIEPVLDTLVPSDREAYRRIRSAVVQHRQPIHDLTVEVYSGAHFQTLVDRTIHSHRLSSLYQWSMLAVVGLLAAFLGLEVLQSSRRARAEAVARRAAEAASLAKSNFLATMSHELRTPLNAIIGFSEIQEKEVFGPMPARYHGYARDIHASADHLLAVLNAILDMVRIDARRLALVEEEFDPSDALRSAVRMTEGERQRAGLRVATDIQTAGVVLRADQRLFRQIVLNLMSNAIRFTPAGGTVRIGLDRDDDGLVLTVSDTGVGIAPGLLERVAEPFFQADQSHARRHQGSGLGLSLVKGFAELHGGSIAIDSKLGRGTTVAVRFPAGLLLRAEFPLAAGSQAVDPRAAGPHAPA